MEKINIGISYGATLEKIENLREVISENIDLIEIPIISETDEIVKFCIKNNIKIAFHLPNSYSSNKLIENINDVDKYIKSIMNILDRYKNVNIEYIIVHFPFVNLSRNGFNYDLKYAINKLELIKKQYKINVYIENVSINEQFYSDIDYKNILKESDIKLCYDIGHANVINNHIKCSKSQNYVKNFFHSLKKEIECIHYYNTPNKKNGEYIIGEHYPFIKFTDYENYGFMSYEDIQNNIKHLPNLKYFIMEVRRNEFIKYKQLGDYNFIKEGRRNHER